MTFNKYVDGGNGGVWWPATVDSSGGTISDPFTKSSTNMPLSGLIIGLTDDGNGIAHLVAMVNKLAAASYTGQGFDTLFSSQTETALISDIKLTMETDSSTLDSAGKALWDAALDRIWLDFALVDASNAWFDLGNLPYPSPDGTIVTSDFAVMEWSDGQQIGTGVANLKYGPLQTNAVPEPSTFILFGAGMVGIVLLRRKRS